MGAGTRRSRAAQSLRGAAEPRLMRAPGRIEHGVGQYRDRCGPYPDEHAHNPAIGENLLQHRAVGRHLPQIQDRSLRQAGRWPPIGLEIRHQNPVGQHGEPIHEAADDGVTHHAGQRHLGAAVAPEQRRQIRMRQHRKHFVGSLCGIRVGESDARAAQERQGCVAPIRVRQVGQMLQ